MKNIYALKSHEIDQKTKSKLITQSNIIHDNAKLYLETYSLPINGNGKIVKTFNSKLSSAKTITFCSENSVQLSVDDINKTAILISVSHRRAGGGWLSGSLAQEESVSRSSTWAIQAGLPQFKDFYLQDKKNVWLGQSGALIVDGLLIYNDNFEQLSNPQKVVFAGVAAANKAALNDDNYWDSNVGFQKRKDYLINNIACAFHELNIRSVDKVVLCAFGTNVFGWKVEESIKVLYEASKYAPSRMNLLCAMCSEQKAKLAQEIYDNLLKEENNVETNKKKKIR